MKSKRLRAYLLLLALLAPLLFGARATALNRYLRVGFNANLPPYQFIDADGASAGMHIDMLEAIGGNRSYDFEFIPYQTNRACFEALERGEIDLILGVIADSIKHDQAVLYTDALTSSQLCMIVDNDAFERRPHNDRDLLLGHHSAHPAREPRHPSVHRRGQPAHGLRAAQAASGLGDDRR